MELISRAEAKARGFKRYFTGKPCRRGHVAERRTCGDGECITCTVGYKVAWEAANPERVRALGVAWRIANPEKARAKILRWRARNPDALYLLHPRPDRGILRPDRSLQRPC